MVPGFPGAIFFLMYGTVPHISDYGVIKEAPGGASHEEQARG
jgi:hypothetical protein